MGSGGVNVQEFDPSVQDASLSIRRGELTDEVTKRAFQNAKYANIYADEALNSLNRGLGLLSDYINTRIESQRKMSEVTGNARDAAFSLRDEAQAGARMIGTAADQYLQQANLADNKLSQNLYKGMN